MKYISLKRKIEHALQVTVPRLLTTDGRKHLEQPTADLPLDSHEIYMVFEIVTKQKNKEYF